MDKAKVDARRKRANDKRRAKRRAGLDLVSQRFNEAERIKMFREEGEIVVLASMGFLRHLGVVNGDHVSNGVAKALKVRIATSKGARYGRIIGRRFAVELLATKATERLAEGGLKGWEVLLWRRGGDLIRKGLIEHDEMMKRADSAQEVD